MEALIIFSGSSLLCFLILALTTRQLNISYPQTRVLRSLGRSISVKDQENDPKGSSKQPSKKSFHKFLNHFAGKSKGTSERDQKLASAGLKGWTSIEWNVLRYFVGFFLTITAFIIGTLMNQNLIPKIQFTIIGFILGYIVPDLWLKSKIKQRTQEILRTLPDVLDLIMVSVEAGLGFDAALIKVVEKQKGILSEELNVVLQEIQMGKPRRDALRDVAKRINIEDFNNVIASLIQADQLGISISNVLRNQSNQIRLKRKQRAQEQAQKAPIKIMIPLVFLIFPSIFIIILGPVIIQVMEVFGKQ